MDHFAGPITNPHRIYFLWTIDPQNRFPAESISSNCEGPFHLFFAVSQAFPEIAKRIVVAFRSVVVWCFVGQLITDLILG